MEFSERTAARFMRIAREWSNPSTLSNLGASKALKLLSIPPEERDAFIMEPHVVNGEEKTVEEMSARELDRVMRERDAAREELESLRNARNEELAETQRRLQDAEESCQETERKFHDAQRRLALAESDKEKLAAEKDAETQRRIAATDELFALKSRPIEVAVQVDEDAVRRAREEAVSETESRMKEQLDEREKARVRAVADKEHAENETQLARDALKLAESERDAAKSDLDAANAKLREISLLSDADTALFHALFTQTQATVNQALDVLGRVKDPAKAEKLKKALSALADAIKEASK